MRETFVGRYSDQVLNMLINRIVEEVKPLQIVLFGSAARGEMHADSNLDLMVVMPNGTHLTLGNLALFTRFNKWEGMDI